MRVLIWIRGSWLMLGATLLCLLLFEGCARLALRGGIVPSGVEHPRASVSSVLASGSEPWIPQYVRELNDAWVVDWRPYVYWASRPYSGDYLNVDARGRRRTWSQPRLEPDAAQIFFFGGSTVWGVGARDDFTIPSLLARELVKGPPVPAVVTNYGQNGYVSTQEVIALLLELRSGNVPDFVIFYDGVNDVLAAHQSGLAGIPQNEGNRRLDFESSQRAFFVRLARRSGGVSLIQRLFGGDPLSPPSVRTPDDVAELAEEVLDAYEGNLRFVDVLAEEFGFQALYFWQPVVWSKQDPTSHEAIVAAGYTPLQALFDATYTSLPKRASLIETTGFHDLSGALDGGSSSSYLDFCHVTEGANARMASEIARALRHRLASETAALRRPAFEVRGEPLRQPDGQWSEPSR